MELCALRSKFPVSGFLALLAVAIAGLRPSIALALEPSHAGATPPAGVRQRVVHHNPRDEAPARGDLVVGQIRHPGEWEPAPQAMHNLMARVRHETDAAVALRTVGIPVDARNMTDYKFLYMSGNSEFHLDPEKLANLRFNLTYGGLLLADAFCGSPDFDRSFRQFISDLFPGHALEEVPLNDVLFSKELNQGAQLDQHTIKCRGENGGLTRCDPPLLEGVKIGGRWVALYSRYDLGAGLEHRNVPGCHGYEPESAFKISKAALWYLMDPRF